MTHVERPMLACVAAALFSLGCSGPCHQTHMVVTFREAHSTTVYHKVGDSSFPVTTRHPARCTASFVCDVRCETWDTGSTEAHVAHRPHSGPMVVSRLCEMDPAGRWRVKA
jgi:hypothetical protein